MGMRTPWFTVRRNFLPSPYHNYGNDDSDEDIFNSDSDSTNDSDDENEDYLLRTYHWQAHSYITSTAIVIS